jgi:putative hydrolase of the HAD superfamily
MIYLFDWGNTLMEDDPDAQGPMYLWENVALCHNARPMLETLSRRHDLYLATNARDSDESDVRKALDRVEIGMYIKGIFCFKRLGVLKPSTDFFNAVVAELGCLPGDIIMVGDDPVNDVRWALENGAQAVLYDPKNIFTNMGYNRICDLMELCG